MQRAGRAAADLVSVICVKRDAPILVLAGPGNNGGDAFEMACLLREQHFETHVVFIGDENGLPIDAANAYRRFVAAGGTTHPKVPQDLAFSTIIDGLFGIGLTRAIEEPYAGLIRTANTLSVRDACPLLALDCPSGLDGDTGAGSFQIDGRGPCLN